jgi:membrane-bound lytic murein transglycosylase A
VPLPAPKSGGPQRLGGIMMAQDTGGAIVGNHVDLFCGSGQYAEFVSGRMKNPGVLHLLVSQRAMAGLRAGNGAVELDVPLHGQNGNGNGNGTGNAKANPPAEQ